MHVADIRDGPSIIFPYMFRIGLRTYELLAGSLHRLYVALELRSIILTS